MIKMEIDFRNFRKNHSGGERYNSREEWEHADEDVYLGECVKVH